MDSFIELFNMTIKILSKFITLLLNFLAFYYPFKLRRADGKHFFCDLPYVARRTLSGFLDYNTRLSLRKVSTRTQVMVDDLPLYITQLKIEMTPFRIVFCEIDVGVPQIMHTVEHEDIDKWISDENSNDEVDENLVDGFKEVLSVLLENRSLRIETFGVAAYCSKDIRDSVAMRKISVVLNVVRDVLSSLNRPLWVQEFKFYCLRNADDVLYVLPYLKPKYLKQIKLYNRFCYSTDWRTIISLDQWKEAGHISIFSPLSRFPINAFRSDQIFEKLGDDSE